MRNQAIPKDEQERQKAELRRLQAEPRAEPRPAAGRFDEPRSFWSRATDEVAAWFGDVGAMRRRQWDEAAGDHTGKGPRREIGEDQRISEDIARRLTSDRDVDASRIQVAVTDRVVTLTGATPTMAMSSRAEHLALGAPHVASVVNRLTVE